MVSGILYRVIVLKNSIFGLQKVIPRYISGFCSGYCGMSWLVLPCFQTNKDGGHWRCNAGGGGSIDEDSCIKKYPAYNFIVIAQQVFLTVV